MKSTRGSKLDRPTTTILQSDLGFHLTPGSPLFEEKKSSNAGVKHAVGVFFERTEAVSRALSRTRERERDPIFPPTWRFGRRRIPWTLGLASLLPGVDITIGVRSIRYRTDRDDWPTTAYTISNLEPWNGGPAIFSSSSPFDHSRLSPATLGTTRARSLRFWVTAPPSERELCVDRGLLVTELVSNPERSEPREPVTRTRRYVHREDGKARGMAPVEREISNLVMDKRLLESQFFVLCWHKSSFLLSSHLCFFKIRAWISWNWINKFSFLSGGFRNMYFNEQVIRDNFVFGWTRGCC